MYLGSVKLYIILLLLRVMLVIGEVSFALALLR